MRCSLRQILWCAGSAAGASVVTWAVMRAEPPAVGVAREAHYATRVSRPPTPLGRGALSEARAVGAESPGIQGERSPLSPDAMTAAVNAMVDERDPVAAMRAFSELLGKLTPENAAAAWTALAGRLQDDEAARYLPVLARAWGAMDGPGALAALKSSDDRAGVRARATALAGWAAHDSAAAAGWYRDLVARSDRDPSDDHHLRSGLIRGLAVRDPGIALELLSTTQEQERRPLMQLLTQEQYRQGIDAAVQWAGGIADGELRGQAIASLLRQHAEEDPAKAAAWLSAQPNLRDDAQATGALARQWAAKDPTAAVDWISSLPEGAARNEAWEDALRSWSRRDPLASSTYLAQLPAGPSRDSAVSSLSRSIARQDPDAAIQWAATIQDPAVRDAALVRTVQLWRTTDEASAAAWVQASGINPDLQQRMLTPLKTLEPKRARRGKRFVD